MAAEIFEQEYRHCLGEMYSGEGKSRVESEVILPDYKEAAHRILRVNTKTRVNSKNIYQQGQVLICEVEGVAVFHVLYLTDRQGERGVPSAILSQENFTYTFKIPWEEETGPEEIASLVELHPENTSYKLLGPRKIALRSDISIALNLKCNRHFSCFSSSQLPEHILTCEKEVKIASLARVHQEDLAFTETISLPKGYLPIGEVCEMDVDLFCGNVVAHDGFVHFTGSCDLQCSYVSQGEESFVSFYQPIEFDKKIEIEHLSKNQICEVNLTPNFLKATTDINEEGENKNILFEIGCTAEIQVYENETVLIPEDAFSTQNHLEVRQEEVLCEEIFSVSDFSVSLRETLPKTEEKWIRAEGIRCAVDFKNSYPEENKIAIEGKLTFRYLGVREDGEMVHLESTHDFKAFAACGAMPEDIRDCRIEIYGGVRGADLVPGPSGIEMRCDLCGRMMLFCKHRILVISSLSLGEKKEKEKAGILFCYPQASEDLWSLAKRYGVSPSVLKEENGMEGDKLPEVIHILYS